MASEKRVMRKRPAAAAAAAAAAAQAVDDAASPFTALVNATSVNVSSLSLSAPSELEAAERAAISDDSPATDSDAQPQRRKRKKLTHYNKRLTNEQRAEAIRMHVDEGKTAASIARLFNDRGFIVPVNTLYTLFRKQARGGSIYLQERRNKGTTCNEEDKQLILKAQEENNELRYDQLKKLYREKHPDSTRCPSNHTLHKWFSYAVCRVARCR